MVQFFKPSWVKFIFLVEWMAFSVFFGIQTENISSFQITNLLWPFVVYYFVGCILVTVGDDGQRKAQSSLKLGLVSLGLVGVDHVIKAMVSSGLLLGEAVKVVPNHFHIAHVQNTTGSWILSTLGSGPAFKPALLSFSLVIFFVAPLVFRFYVSNHGRSYWPAVSYVCFVAGMLSYSIDIAMRGLVIDYINMPGVVTADLKDFLLTFGVAAFFIEALKSPSVSMGWKGWCIEYRELRALVGGFSRFVVGEIFGANRK